MFPPTHYDHNAVTCSSSSMVGLLPVRRSSARSSTAATASSQGAWLPVHQRAGPPRWGLLGASRRVLFQHGVSCLLHGPRGLVQTAGGLVRKRGEVIVYGGWLAKFFCRTSLETRGPPHVEGLTALGRDWILFPLAGHRHVAGQGLPKVQQCSGHAAGTLHNEVAWQSVEGVPGKDHGVVAMQSQRKEKRWRKVKRPG